MDTSPILSLTTLQGKVSSARREGPRDSQMRDSDPSIAPVPLHDKLAELSQAVEEGYHGLVEATIL